MEVGRVGEKGRDAETNCASAHKHLKICAFGGIVFHRARRSRSTLRRVPQALYEGCAFGAEEPRRCQRMQRCRFNQTAS